MPMFHRTCSCQIGSDMELSQLSSSFKNCKAILLCVTIFFITDACIHYWSSSVKSKVLPTSMELVPDYIPFSYMQPESNVSSRLIRRLSHYKKLCLAYSSSIQKDTDMLESSSIYMRYYFIQRRVVVDIKSKFAVCLQAKGGSNFWKQLFYHKGVSTNGELIYSEEKVQAMDFVQFITLNDFKKSASSLLEQNYTLFVFGRNPWYRLVSLYRQKIEGRLVNDTTYRYVKAACLKRPCDTFRELLECVLYTWSKGFPDRHWEPLTTHCGLCSVPYHFIGSTEMMNEEAAYILTSAGAKGNTSTFLQTARIKSIREVEQKSAHVDYKSYYDDIPDHIIQRLKDMYKHDLALLGYPDTPT